MTVSSQQLQEWMNGIENEHLEFKEAKSNFHFEKLVKYCAALANEGGGHIVLGVTDARPRHIVGSQAFTDLERTKAGLIERLHLRIDACEVMHPNGRVLVFTAPSRPIGMPIAFEGAYWMRAGEDLVPMTPDMLRRVFNETGSDFSAEICPKATIDDLDPTAIEVFLKRWGRRSKNDSLSRLPVEQVLADAELLDHRGVTYSALVLMGKRASLGRFLPQAEVIFEYRSSEVAGPANQRLEFREGFLLFYENLWKTINLRNDVQHFQDGLFMIDVPTFAEGSVREAILNAVGHRDYRLSGSVFIRQYQRRIEIVSPGGFPAGINPRNILYRQSPRNRRIAEVFGKCDLVERSGQGANRMFEESIRQSKSLPDFTHTDDYQVALTLHGEIQDPAFLRFLEQVGEERVRSFCTQDFLVLDLVHHEQTVPPELQTRLHQLLDQGIIESFGRGRGTRYLLPRKFYGLKGKAGVYTRKRGLDRGTNKELLLKHIQDNHPIGARFDELQQVLPALSRSQIQKLLKELKAEGRIRNEGRTKGARWYAIPIFPTEKAQY
jgi:ATP-dependent DNA helicase RecG